MLFAVEALSPSSTRADRFTKRRLYQERRIPAFRVVDPDARLVEVWTRAATVPAVGRDRVAWHPAGAIEPLVVELLAFVAVLVTAAAVFWLTAVRVGTAECQSATT